MPKKTFEFNVSHPPSIHTNHLSKYYLLDTIFHETFDHYLMHTYTHSGCACALHAGARCKQINRKHCLLIETAHDKNLKLVKSMCLENKYRQNMKNDKQSICFEFAIQFKMSERRNPIYVPWQTPFKIVYKEMC